jgi:hypothetical protein
MLGQSDCEKVKLTPQGWDRVAELKRAHISSRYAFFARQFKNDDLDRLFDGHLRQAVLDTGYELRPLRRKLGTLMHYRG